MRIPSGKTDVYLYFVAKDSNGDPVTGISSSWTVYRSRNGAAEVAYTTPTITEIDAANMPGVYALLIDEDTTITSGADSEEVCIHITHASIEPVIRTFELYRRTYTSGETFDDAEVSAIKAKTDNLPSDPADASVIAGRFDTLDTSVADLPTNAELATALAGADDAVLAAIAALNNLSAAQVNAEVDTALADYDGPTHTELTAELATADDAVLAQVALVKAKTDNLPSDPADQSLVIAATDALATLIGDVPTNAELATALASADDAVLAAIDALPTAAEVRDAVFAQTLDGHSFLEHMRGFVAVMYGRRIDTGNSRAYRNLGDTKDVVVATATDVARSAPTLDLS